MKPQSSAHKAHFIPRRCRPALRRTHCAEMNDRVIPPSTRRARGGAVEVGDLDSDKYSRILQIQAVACTDRPGRAWGWLISTRSADHFQVRLEIVIGGLDFRLL